MIILITEKQIYKYEFCIKSINKFIFYIEKDSFFIMTIFYWYLKLMLIQYKIKKNKKL
jgi:hypothetical protein